MPDGVSNRAAAALRTALVGKAVTRFEAVELVGPEPVVGRVVERVECHGKQLDIHWDDGLILHTHLRRSGVWHLYRAGERWRRSAERLRVCITVPGWVAVCFSAPVVETFREFDRYRHPGFGRLGPDLCRQHSDLTECANRMLDYFDPDMAIAEVLLDQHVVCGIGNVFRSEVLWACGVHPLAAVGELDAADCDELIHAAAGLLRANLDPTPQTDSGSGGLDAYGRNGQRCSRCGDTIQVGRVGDHPRLLYWCPGCQVRFDPAAHRAPVEAERPMDPHPAAAKFLAELPWRRNDTLAG